MVGRMPIPSVNDWGTDFPKELNVFVDDRDNFVAVQNRQGSAWAEVILNVHNNQSGVVVDFDCQFFPRYFVALIPENKDSLNGSNYEP
jgi:hypothetical protein